MKVYLLVVTEDEDESYSVWGSKQDAKIERGNLINIFGLSIYDIEIYEMDVY